jgi:hypothetical protein
MKVLEMTQHLNVARNPGTKEWFCTTCGRTSDHASALEAATIVLQKLLGLPKQEECHAKRDYRQCPKGR